MEIDMFEKFPSLTRFSHGWTITEKLDGTNAAINIVSIHDDGLSDLSNGDAVFARVDQFYVMAQSRTKLIWPGKTTDNAGFAQFVKDNAEELVEKLGEGRHFGEWVGPGIGKRHYNLKEKQFALFNVHRWRDTDLPSRVTTVPCFVLNEYLDNPGEAAKKYLNELSSTGSRFVPQQKITTPNVSVQGFMNPEGVVMYHGPSKTSFKKTFDYDEQGKWAEKA
jgi:hypothetical protein